MKNLVLACFLVLCAPVVFAQQKRTMPKPADTLRKAARPLDKNERPNPYLSTELLQPIPLTRELFHDKINNEQKRADAADGKTDNRITIPGYPTRSATFTVALIKEVDRLAIMTENMPANGRDETVENQQKIQSLRALWEMLRQYNSDPKPNALFYRYLVSNMHDMIVASNENKSLYYVMANPDIYSLDNSRVLLDNQPEARAYIYTEMGKADPVMMMKRLEEFAKDTFAAEIIKAAARLDPRLIFNYTLSTNLLLKTAVYHTKDPYVQAIVQVTAESKAPLKALPFVSYIANRTKTIDEIDSIADNSLLSFETLVKLRISGDTLTKLLYTEELEYRTLKYFVRHMNELHDTTDVVRFACIDSLSPQALYYIMVYGREEIYTSSFLGTFKRMMERMSPMKSDAFLSSLRYDHFRTFIRLCAGYNTLSVFLDSMEAPARSTLMSRFAGGLQDGADNDLEDAVNVADAFGSIKDSALFVFLREKVQENYSYCATIKNKKGMVIYNLLSMLIESSSSTGTDSTGTALASKKLKLPPINVVPFKTLSNDTGTIFERVFFYGDDDGKTAYDGFIDDYRKNPKWKVDTTSCKYWATVTSTFGKPIVMYANMPLKAPEDEKAIDSLDIYLADNEITPTIVIHRGHSYHVKTTLSKLDSNARVVVLGSCGGYHNVAKVLSTSPDAHIISSKQTGVGAINEPIIRAINTQLQDGSDINWITIWKGLDEYFSKRTDLYDKYTDYIPPHKNLGVIFIKAYSQMMDK